MRKRGVVIDGKVGLKEEGIGFEGNKTHRFLASYKNDVFQLTFIQTCQSLLKQPCTRFYLRLMIGLNPSSLSALLLYSLNNV